MPIVFEQPGPFAPATSVGAGAAQQFTADLPAVLGQQRTLAGLYESMSRAGGQHLPAPAPAVNPGGGGATLIDPRPYQPQPSSDPLTQAESLRLQRLQSAMSAVKEQVQGGSLSEEEGNQFLLHLQTGIDPLKQQQERARVQMMGQQVQQMQHATALQESMRQEHEEYRARGLQGSLTTLTDPATGERLPGVYHTDEHGRPRRLETEDAQNLKQQQALMIQQHREEMTQLQQAHALMEEQDRAVAETAMSDPNLSQAQRLEVGQQQRRRIAEARAARARQRLEVMAQQRQERVAILSRGGRQGAAAVDPNSPEAAGFEGQGGGAPPQATSQVNPAQAVDAVVGQLQQRQQAQAGRRQGAVSETRSTEDQAIDSWFNHGGGVMTPWGTRPDMQTVLNAAERPERPNDESSASPQDVARVGPIVTSLYNQQGRGRQSWNPAVRSLGVMTDLLIRAGGQGRGLTRHELQLYRRLHRDISGEFQNHHLVAL